MLVRFRLRNIFKKVIFEGAMTLSIKTFSITVLMMTILSKKHPAY
jgi:hypothetical protein